VSKRVPVSEDVVLAAVEAWYSRPRGIEYLTAVRIAADLLGGPSQEPADLNPVSLEVAEMVRALHRRGVLTATPRGDTILSWSGQGR
jgi:hypothetical protein